MRPRRVYLHPGEAFATCERVEITTLLGSCVAVCLWDGVRLVGAMNHYLLPRGSIVDDRPNAMMRYGDAAIPALVEMAIAEGASRTGLSAKIFGGARVVATPHEATATHFATENIAIAERALSALGIPIAARDVGGKRARKIIFAIADGVVRVKEL